MDKYKICPVCKTKNSPTVLECVDCGNDLMSVRIVDDSFSDENDTIPQNKTASEESDELVRVCDCGQVNALAARKCIKCGEDISDIVPIPNKANSEKQSYCISSIDGLVVLNLISPSEHIIGREYELADYLKPKSFVSRKHVIITVTSDGMFIQNLSSANGTYINNEKIDRDNAYKLCVGDELGLGGNKNQNGRQELAAYFVVGKM